jgi:hypothetical protein
MSLRRIKVYPFGWNYQWIALGLFSPLEYDSVSLADMLLQIGRGVRTFVNPDTIHLSHHICFSPWFFRPLGRCDLKQINKR